MAWSQSAQGYESFVAPTFTKSLAMGNASNEGRATFARRLTPITISYLLPKSTLSMK